MRKLFMVLSAICLFASCSTNPPSEYIEITEESFTQHQTWTEDSSDFFD